MTKKPTQVPSFKPSRVTNSKPSTKPSSTPSSQPTPLPNTCYDDNELFNSNGHLDQLTTDEFTYTEALAHAATMPKCCGKTAHLVTAADQAEIEFVWGIMYGGLLAYIGLDDKDNDFQYD